MSEFVILLQLVFVSKFEVPRGCRRSGAMLVSEGHAAPGAMQMVVACTATWDNGDIPDLAAAEDHVWVCVPTVARVCIHKGCTESRG